MPRLTLSFLGCFHVCLDDRPVTDFKSNKVRALLAYLAVEADRPHRREALAGLLWPDWPDRDALSNLRYALASLRRTIGDHTAAPPFLLITPHTIQFNPASDHWLDVAELGRQIADSSCGAADGAKLVSAQSLYRGSFLAGFSIGDAAPFEEWALLRREQIGLQVMSLLGNLAAYHEARGDYHGGPGLRSPAGRPGTMERGSPSDADARADFGRSAQRRIAPVLTCRRICSETSWASSRRRRRSRCTRRYARGCSWRRRRGDKETRRQGDRGHPDSLSACLPVSPAPPFVAREDQLARLDDSLRRSARRRGTGGLRHRRGGERQDSSAG